MALRVPNGNSLGMGVETGPDMGGKASLVDDKPRCEPKQARAWGPLLAGLGSHCVKPGARTRRPKLRRHFHVDRTHAGLERDLSRAWCRTAPDAPAPAE